MHVSVQRDRRELFATEVLMDQLVASNDTTPERINVKAQRKSSLVDMRRRMTNECVARVKRSVTTFALFHGSALLH